VFPNSRLQHYWRASASGGTAANSQDAHAAYDVPLDKGSSRRSSAGGPFTFKTTQSVLLSDYNLIHLTKSKSKFETWFAIIIKIMYY
jgi:hypothetical protein